MHYNENIRYVCILEILGPRNLFLLFHHAFSTLERLAPAIGDAVNDPVALLLTSNEVLLFEDTKMVRKFRICNLDYSLDDADTERLGEK